MSAIRSVDDGATRQMRSRPCLSDARARPRPLDHWGDFHARTAGLGQVAGEPIDTVLQDRVPVARDDGGTTGPVMALTAVNTSRTRTPAGEGEFGGLFAGAVHQG